MIDKEKIVVLGDMVFQVLAWHESAEWQRQWSSECGINTSEWEAFRRPLDEIREKTQALLEDKSE